MNWMGVTYRYMGEYEASISHISTAMKLDESYSLPYLSRGITYEEMGQPEVERGRLLPLRDAESQSDALPY